MTLSNMHRVIVIIVIAAGFPVETLAQHDSAHTIMYVRGYPQVFELNTGEQHVVRLKYKGKALTRNIKLISVKSYFEPYPLFKKEPREIYSKAEVEVEVSGKRILLLHRPYQMPVAFNGLRLYIESVKDWTLGADIQVLDNIQKEVRLSVCADGESWGPAMIFPIKNYHWKAGVYQNTWSALVPYNVRYYHRGEDYGAIPGRLDVVSPFDGKIIASPLPSGDGKSNAVCIQNESGVVFRVAHMDIETILDHCKAGSFIKSGTVLGKTGMTWDGRKSQVNDAHCHTELQYNGTQLASYPYLMEAYLKSYPDKIIAVAGGYQYTVAGNELVLDATRSIAREGEQIKSYSWKLHTGEIRDSSTITVHYDRPGLYTEELTVKTASGAEDRDFLQVRVFDTVKNKKLAYGWAVYDPVRNIKPGTSVLFWNRLVNTKGPVLIDFGDGTAAVPVNKEIYHIYKTKGRYVTTLSSNSIFDEPVTIKMEVVVE
ncbi:PKD domain-containing protein [Agriterribacter sp.]|uniref:PKD domain-containing protein n=1 Tax=Agriterribacter sp. TaxID=2821509 RepID=UPI002CDB1456|nr:PKD domain-containing protein [Agriterribacter sp.]HRP55316.1 PKD domain-containing protein [Agriterribacter sp.]